MFKMIEYSCTACRARFDQLVSRDEDTVPCAACGAPARKQLGGRFVRSSGSASDAPTVDNEVSGMVIEITNGPTVHAGDAYEVTNREGEVATCVVDGPSRSAEVGDGMRVSMTAAHLVRRPKVRA